MLSTPESQFDPTELWPLDSQSQVTVPPTATVTASGAKLRPPTVTVAEGEPLVGAVVESGDSVGTDESPPQLVASSATIAPSAAMRLIALIEAIRALSPRTVRRESPAPIH